MDVRSDPVSAAPTALCAHEERDASPFVVIEPIRRTAPLVFASPHSGRIYPPELLAQSRLPLMSLRRSEDAFVDELFSAAVAHGAPMLSALISRAYVDLNRDAAEIDPEMFSGPVGSELADTPRVQAGLGAIPKIAGDGRHIYQDKLRPEEALRRVGAVYAPYHSQLRELLDDTVALFGCAVLIDCHSMPSSARGPQQPDVVLGDRYGSSCHPSITTLAEATLRRLGYKVIRNAPYAGGYTTQAYGSPSRRVHALQIEVNRSLYLDERTLERSSGFRRVRADMARLTETLVAAELHRSLA
jgi:N-formylglutamate amidohydrolase